jgi:hypothetical protein
MAYFKLPTIKSAHARLSFGRSVIGPASTSNIRSMTLRWRPFYKVFHRSFSSSQSGYSFASTGSSISTGFNKSNNSHYSTSNVCGHATKKKGRAFAADQSLLPAVDAVKFPSVKGTNLHGDSVVVPESFNNVNDTLFKNGDGKTGEPHARDLRMLHVPAH